MNNFIFIYFLFAKRKKINIFSHYTPRVQRTIVNHSSQPQSDTKLADVRSKVASRFATVTNEEISIHK